MTITFRTLHRKLLGAGTCLITLAINGCGSDPETPILEATGPAVTSGPLSKTPIRFQTTDYYLRPTVIAAEEGRLVVPERHQNPDGRKIAIRYVRFPSHSDTPAAPIVYLAGGPGGSGTWSASGDRYELFQRMREVADVIALDQRGTWGTEPYLVCPGNWSYPLDEPRNEMTLRRVLKPFLNHCWNHFEDQADLGAFNTTESVGDLEALRQALGAEKLNLWGISYGTHLALAYLRAHPDRVERAILAGLEGPDHTYKLPARVDDVFTRVADAIDADPKARRVTPDFLGSLTRLLKQLEEAPVAVELKHPKTGEPVTVVVGVEDLRQAVVSSLGEREDIEEIVERGVPILEGDFKTLGLFALQTRLENRELAMSLSMDCAAGVTVTRAAVIKRQAADALLGDPNMWLNAACPHWPVAVQGDAYRAPVESDVPTLFISGTLDGRTPPANAEDILPGFVRGHHMVIEAGSHDDDLFLSSPLILEAMMEFWRGEQPPDRIALDPVRFKRP